MITHLLRDTLHASYHGHRVRFHKIAGTSAEFEKEYKMADPLELSFLDRRGQNAEHLQTTLVDRIWGLPASIDAKDAGIYLDHYNALSTSIDTSALSFQSHNDALEVIEHIRNGRVESLRDLKARIATADPPWLCINSDKAIQKAIDFAVPLWLMVRTQSWKEEDSICKFVKGLFPDPSAYVQPQASTVDEDLSFNAHSLYKIGGIDLVWTSQLNNHLLLNLKTSELFVFKHASLLGRRRDAGQSDIYPEGLLRETAETMAILFPFAETSHKSWNRRVRKRADIDVETGIACNTPRNLDHYRYWHARLKLIQSTYDNSAPRRIRQWLHDRRDSNRFYTFWFAVVAICLTLLFGLIQSVTGIIQALQL